MCGYGGDFSAGWEGGGRRLWVDQTSDSGSARAGHREQRSAAAARTAGGTARAHRGVGVVLSRSLGHTRPPWTTPSAESA